MSANLLNKARKDLDGVPAQTRIEVARGVHVRRKKNGLTVMSLHYSAVPERDPTTEEGRKWYEREHRKYSSESRWKKEQEIDANATGGENVFGKMLADYWDQIVITDPKWYPDGRYDVVGGFDHGAANATCLLKAYVEREEYDLGTGKKKAPTIIFAGEYYEYRRDEWENNVDQNVEKMLDMPDMDRARWLLADPSIFYDTRVEKKGSPTNIYKTYKENRMFKMSPYGGVRSDVTFVQWMLSDFWHGIGQGRPPRCKIVCRMPSDRPTPGLHPYDCPNLIWELKRAKRVEMTARQLQTKSQDENLQDKNNHARDAFKYVTGNLRRATAIPIEEYIAGQLTNLDPTTQHMRARFLMSEMAMKGELDPQTGKPRKKKNAGKSIDLRRSPGAWIGALNQKR